MNSGAPVTLALPVMSCRAVWGDCKGRNKVIFKKRTIVVKASLAAEEVRQIPVQAVVAATSEGSTEGTSEGGKGHSKVAHFLITFLSSDLIHASGRASVPETALRRQSNLSSNCLAIWSGMVLCRAPWLSAKDSGILAGAANSNVNGSSEITAGIADV